jgi:hypothetical protein
MADVTIKIPDPIMEPATKLVASINPRERFNSVLFSGIKLLNSDLLLFFGFSPKVQNLF